MSLSVSTHMIESHVRLLKNWDTNSKKNLIIRLVKSLEPEPSCDFSSCFGAWQDNRDAEEIVREMMELRQKSSDIERF